VPQGQREDRQHRHQHAIARHRRSIPFFSSPE
jgi:hypothetical protein